MSIIRINIDDAEATSRKGGLVQHAIYTMRGVFRFLRLSFLAKYLTGGLENVVVKPARCI